MFIRLLNHFVHDTPLNAILKKNSLSKYELELYQLTAEYDQQAKELPKRFVIFNFPRSGSNFLCTMLDNHPDILCHQELFNPGRIFYSRDFHILLNGGNEEGATPWEDLIHGKDSFSNKKQRDLEPEKFLMKVWRHNYGANAVGFNLFPTHVPNMAPSLLQDKGVKKILLVRKNKIKCYVSREIARKTDIWADFSKNSSQSGLSQELKVNVSTAKLLAWSQKYDEYFRRLRYELAGLGEPFLDLTYEDIAGDSSSYFKESILEFIGVTPKVDSLQPLNKKQSSKKLSDLISNYDELRRNLTGTELETFL